MNGLKDGVVVDSFDLPSNDPAGGVHLTLQTTVTNVSDIANGSLSECSYPVILPAVPGWRATELDRIPHFRRSDASGPSGVDWWLYPCAAVYAKIFGCMPAR